MKSKLLILISALLVILFIGCNPEEQADKSDKDDKGAKEEKSVKAEKNENELPIQFSSVEELKEMFEWQEAEGGMFYLDVKVGDGEVVEEGDLIDAYYTLWMSDGKAFQSNRYRIDPNAPFKKTPFSAKLAYGSLIDGWVKLVQGMKVGGVRRLIIPSEFAYGPNDYNGIPGGSTLVFELEVINATHPIKAEDAEKELPISFKSIEELEKEYDWIDFEDGMKYLDVKVGEGREVKENDAIKAYYTLWLPDGTPFQSNRYLLEGADPAYLVPFDSVLAYGRLIPGWVKMVQGMKDGGVRRLIIPAKYAYGDDDHNGIPGGSTLVFELEIVKSQAMQ